AAGKAVVAHRATAGIDRRRIDVGETKRLREPVTEQREADEARARAPLEHALLARHRPAAQVGDEILSEPAAAALQVGLVGDANSAKLHAAVRLELPQPRLDVAMLQSLPETQRVLRMGIRPAQ